MPSSCSSQLPLPTARGSWVGCGLEEQICCCCAALEGNGAPGWAGRPSLQCESRAFPTWRVFPEGSTAPARGGSDGRGKPSAGEPLPQGPCLLLPTPRVPACPEPRRRHTGAQGRLRKGGRGAAGNMCRQIPAAGACPLPVPGQKSAGWRRGTATFPERPPLPGANRPRRRTSCCRALSVAGLMLRRDEVPTEESARSNAGGDSSWCTRGATGVRGAGLEGRKGGLEDRKG